MTEDHRNEDTKKLSDFERKHLERKYQEQLTEATAWFSECMRKKAEVHKAASKDGLTSEEIENMFPPEFRGTWEEILDRLLPEGARRKK